MIGVLYVGSGLEYLAGKMMGSWGRYRISEPATVYTENGNHVSPCDTPSGLLIRKMTMSWAISDSCFRTSPGMLFKVKGKRLGQCQSFL